MTRVAVSVPVLRWAARRAHLSDDALPTWLTSEDQPTLRELEDFSRRTHTAIGWFFLPEPPDLPLPITDFRTERAEPGSALLGTIYLCQQRQDWYREYAHRQGLPPVSFVGSARLQDAPEMVAQRLRETLGVSAEALRQFSTGTEALRYGIDRAEDAGVMVMAEPMASGDHRRPLNADDFRGFVLSDDRAPLVFLNGADSPAAQIFTLANGIAHLCLGDTGVSDAQSGCVSEHPSEHWCNEVAAAWLTPLPGWHVDGRSHMHGGMRKDSGKIHLDERVGRRFASAVIGSALEGETLFRDAFRLLGVHKTAEFQEAARELGLI